MAIIGVLAAIAIPQYQNYLNRSSEGACEAETASIRGPVASDIADRNDDRAFIGADGIITPENFDDSEYIDLEPCSGITLTATADGYELEGTSERTSSAVPTVAIPDL